MESAVGSACNLLSLTFCRLDKELHLFLNTQLQHIMRLPQTWGSLRTVHEQEYCALKTNLRLDYEKKKRILISSHFSSWMRELQAQMLAIIFDNKWRVYIQAHIMSPRTYCSTSVLILRIQSKISKLSWLTRMTQWHKICIRLLTTWHGQWKSKYFSSLPQREILQYYFEMQI